MVVLGNCVAVVLMSTGDSVANGGFLMRGIRDTKNLVSDAENFWLVAVDQPGEREIGRFREGQA